ncbi:hypothetical protein C4K39_3926 [Pseudomonas sessilinigenes]|nr:hypothetical protein C4K39_3926 [Pseudomonas sessilinigenes]
MGRLSWPLPSGEADHAGSRTGRPLRQKRKPWKSGSGSNSRWGYRRARWLAARRRVRRGKVPRLEACDERQSIACAPWTGCG